MFTRDTNQEMKTWLSNYKVLTCIVQSLVLRKEKKIDTNNSTWCNPTVRESNSKAHTILILMSEANKIIRHSSSY